MKPSLSLSAVAALLLAATSASAEVKVNVGHHDNDNATAEFKFAEVPAPAKSNAASSANVSIIDGQKDANSPPAAALHDGKLPSDADEPAANFFFAPGTDGGRIRIDLGAVITVKQVNTYSWHGESRAPQVYTLYAADGAAEGFAPKPLKGVDPLKVGWKLIAKVDTRPKTGDVGGQYGVSIADDKANLGKFRYLLLDAHRTEEDDDMGNTFFSEINVINADPSAPAIAAAPEPAATAPAAVQRSLRDIQSDLGRVSKEAQTLLPSPDDLFDPAKRAQLAPKLIPNHKQFVSLLTELSTREPAYTYQTLSTLVHLRCRLALLGDADSAKALADMAASPDSAMAMRGNLAQRRVAWWQAAKDEKAQEKILADMQTLAAASPRNGNIVSTLESFRDTGAASPALADKAELIIVNSMTSPQVTSIKEQRTGRINQRDALNKPFELAGPTVDGKDFSTTQYKGKVVLVDMWATWCGPCVKELPRVKALYAKYHDQGLEIVGVSCDEDGEKLAAYTKKQEMPWPQMWDKKAQTATPDDAWHPLAKKYGVFAIPQMFLIDRNGVLRTVNARENMEEMIPKLLEEKPVPAPAK